MHMYKQTLKITRRFQELQKSISKKIYNLEESLTILKTIGNAKFRESVEAHVRLYIDTKYTNQQVRNSLILTHGTGKAVRIAVFVENNLIPVVLKMGATVAGNETLIEEIAAGKINFDLLLTTPQLMPKLAKFGKILGPKGLMPSPKFGTVVTDFEKAIFDFKKGKIEYRADAGGIIHLPFGKSDFPENHLKTNLLDIYNSIEKSRPSGLKGQYFKTFHICTTMSPSLKISLLSLKKTKLESNEKQ